MITNNDIKKASENFDINKNRLYEDIIASSNKARKPRLLPLRRIAAVLVAVAIFLAGCTTAYAVSPEFRNYINLWFMGNDKKENKVPEGYKGVYSIIDLDNIRNDLNSKYILMKDLTFSDSDFVIGGAYEGGWTAIGNDENPFTGEFNGNGHIISNIALKQGDIYTGLFGAAGYNKLKENEYKFKDNAYNGIIKNLGLNGVKANINIENDKKRYIGSVIASGNYVTGCFTENVNFNISFFNFKLCRYGTQFSEDDTHYFEYDEDTSIGGVCGRADLIDSCYSDVDIKFTENDGLREKFGIDSILMVGGVAGISCDIMTSYYSGIITFNGESFGSGEVLNYNTFMPYLVSEKRFNEIVEKLTPAYTDNPRKVKQFRAFFQKKPAYLRGRDLLIRDAGSEEEFYIFEPHVTKREILHLEEILLKVYDKDEFRKATWDDGVKSGINYCYTLEEGNSYDQSHFENFDFEKIWVMKDGVPKLQIFE